MCSRTHRRFVFRRRHRGAERPIRWRYRCLRSNHVKRPMLINCVAYQDGRRLADIELRQIREYLACPGCFVWVALRDATAEELALVQSEFDLHELAVEDAIHGRQRPKVEEYEDTL